MAKGFFKGSQVLKKAPAARLPQCGVCGLSKVCSTPKMEVSGAGGKEILVVLSHPTPRDDAAGRLLSGDEGPLLSKAMRFAGIQLQRDCWITSALICAPEKGAPAIKEIEYCRPNLRTAIQELRPRVIIPFGGAATRAVIGSVWREDIGRADRWYGWQIPDQSMNTWICPMYDLGDLVAEQDRPLAKVMNHYFTTWMLQAAALNGRPWEEVPAYSKYIKILDRDSALSFLEWLIRTDYEHLAFDYECNCLQPEVEDAEILSCSVAWGGDKAAAFPWSDAVAARMSTLLQNDMRKIACNLKFEERWTLFVLGHGVNNWWHDTMLKAHELDNRPNISGLKFQSYVRLGMPAYDDHIAPFMQSNTATMINRILEEVTWRDLLYYNALDSLLEYELAFIQNEDSEDD